MTSLWGGIAELEKLESPCEKTVGKLRISLAEVDCLWNNTFSQEFKIALLTQFKKPVIK
jgi:hypothetical protein